MELGSILEWFAGGSHRYMTLVHSMNHDIVWFSLTVLLDLLIASGYVLIAAHWRRNEALLTPSPAKRALGNMKKIFVFCGICGYLFIPVKLFWPAWRLCDIVLGGLAYFTWRYALGARDLRVVYEQLEKAAGLEQDLERSRADAKRKSEFLNAISHDLKTPLNGLVLQAELAELNLASDEFRAAAEALSEIKCCAQATADLLNRFLEFASLDGSEEPNRWQVVELDTMVRGVYSQLHAVAIARRVHLRNEIASGVTLITDRMKFERIMLNLIDNAIKFTSEGDVRLLAEVRPREVAVHVVDTGIGIEAEHQARIFDEFIQVNNPARDRRNGFGLGLAIARRLAGQLGGTLSVESHAGVGSRFTLVHALQTEDGAGREVGATLDQDRVVNAATAGCGR